MVAWGPHWQESDSYLDLYNHIREPFEKQIEEYRFANEDVIKSRELAIVSAAGLYADLIYKNPLIHYATEKEIADGFLMLLDRVLEHCDFKSWKKPKERRKRVEELRDRMKEISETEVRYTTLRSKDKCDLCGGPAAKEIESPHGKKKKLCYGCFQSYKNFKPAWGSLKIFHSKFNQKDLTVNLSFRDEESFDKFQTFLDSDFE